MKYSSRFASGLMLLAAGCSSSDKKSNIGPSTEGGTCSVTLAPGSDDPQAIQEALDSVTTGDTVCLSAGTYHLNRSLSLTGATNITLRGTGATRDAALLDFTAQSSADGGVGSSQGLLVTTDSFRIENLSIKNTAGNGVKFSANGAVFQNIKVYWDTPAAMSNGAYAIYPTQAQNVHIDGCETYGASDAGIYAGQCHNILITNNDAHGNVLGIEIENTTNAEAYGNNVHGNTCGFLLDLLPGLQKKDSNFYFVHDNQVVDNNIANFAQPNTTAGVMPPGTGMMILAADDLDITNNTFQGNGGVAITIISYDTVDLATALAGGTPDTPDPGTNRYPQRIYIHGNTYTNNGTNPQDIYKMAVDAQGDGGTGTIPYYVLWDGDLDPTGGQTDADAALCLGTPEQTQFLNFHGAGLIDPSQWTTAVTAHSCTGATVPPVNPPAF